MEVTWINMGNHLRLTMVNYDGNHDRLTVMGNHHGINHGNHHELTME